MIFNDRRHDKQCYDHNAKMMIFGVTQDHRVWDMEPGGKESIQNREFKILITNN